MKKFVIYGVYENLQLLVRYVCEVQVYSFSWLKCFSVWENVSSHSNNCQLSGITYDNIILSTFKINAKNVLVCHCYFWCNHSIFCWWKCTRHAAAIWGISMYHLKFNVEINANVLLLLKLPEITWQWRWQQCHLVKFYLASCEIKTFANYFVN